MRYGIFSDIHGNLEALETVLAAYKKERIDHYFCVGDVVGYGANPHECIEAVRNLGAVCIAGNHDWAVVEKVDIEYFNPMARAAVLWTRKVAGRDDMAFLDRLKLIYKNDDFILVHGTLNEPAYFHYLVDSNQAELIFPLMDRNVCFVGHSHVAGVFVRKENKIEYSNISEIKIEEGCQYIVNAGSVGQPRDNNPAAVYCVYDTDEKVIQVKRVDYDVEAAQKRILEAGLPSFLAVRLAAGR